MLNVWLFETPWTVSHQIPLCMEFSWQEYWSGLLFSPPGDLPDPGIEPTSLVSLALAGSFFTIAPRERTVFQNNKATNSFWSKMIQRLTNKVLLNSTRSSAYCYVAAWMGGEMGGNGYMYMHGWILLLCTWNFQSIVNLIGSTPT